MNVLTDEKIKSIVSEYLTNGLCKTLALKSLGYKSYKTGKTLKLFDNPRVKAELQRQQAKRELKNADRILTKEKIQLIWSEVALNQEITMSDRLKALELLAKSKAMFVEVSAQIDVVKAAEISAERRVELERIAAIRVEQMRLTGAA